MIKNLKTKNIRIFLCILIVISIALLPILSADSGEISPANYYGDFGVNVCITSQRSDYSGFTFQCRLMRYCDAYCHVLDCGYNLGWSYHDHSSGYDCIKTCTPVESQSGQYYVYFDGGSGSGHGDYDTLSGDNIDDYTTWAEDKGLNGAWGTEGGFAVQVLYKVDWYRWVNNAYCYWASTGPYSIWVYNDDYYTWNTHLNYNPYACPN